jgi:hypothetical protein
MNEKPHQGGHFLIPFLNRFGLFETGEKARPIQRVRHEWTMGIMRRWRLLPWRLN